MYTDIPQFTRCCFCAPLRIGLMSWGYIKLILSLVLWGFVINGFVEISVRSLSTPVGLILFVIAQIIDNIFTVILVVAAHKKHDKLFYVYYIYSIVFLVFLVMICGLHIVQMFMSAMSYPHPYVVQILILVIASSITLLMEQVYIILLVRSELYKLRDRTNIQFSNHAGEAECSAYVEKKHSTTSDDPTLSTICYENQ